MAGASKRGKFLGDNSELFIGAPEELVGLTGWSQSGTLQTGNNSRKVTLQANFTDQMQSHLIQFNAPGNNVNTGAGNGIITQAEIIWKIRGNAVRRVITVTDGASIAGCAEAVEIRIVDVTNTATRTDYVVSCQVSPGVRSSYEQPPHLVIDGFRSTDPASTLPFPFAIFIAAGAFVDWPIPDDVGAISAYLTAYNPTNPLTDTDIEVTFISLGNANLKRFGLPGMFKWIPMSGGVRTIRLGNNSADSIYVSCILGIEG